MKWLTVIIVAFAGLLSSLPASFAETADKVEIQSISHTMLPEAKESISFKLSGQAAPKIFAIKEDNPRLVLDFPGSFYKGKNVVPLPEGKLATAIRIGLHQKPEQKVRVVVDLAKDTAVQHTVGEYVEADRTLTVTLVAASEEQQQKLQAAKEAKEAKDAKNAKEAKEAVPTDQKPQADSLPSPQELAAKPLHEKPVPPVLHRKEAKEEPPAQEKANGAKTPQLLDITFDDSSSKGEMVLFHLNDFYPPTVSAVEKDTPRVFCDFMEMGLGTKVQENIHAKGKYVQRIRTTKHKKPDKVQVVLELSPDRDYDLQQVFFKNDNLFVLIVNELTPEKKTATGQKSENGGKPE